MTTKLSVSVCEKRGLPNFGSHGASCNLEIAISDEALETNPEKLRQRLREAYATCRAAVTEELQRACSSPADASVKSRCSTNKSGAQKSVVVEVRQATDSQIRALRAIAHRIGLDLHAELHKQHGIHRLDQLTLQQASQLIDQLQMAAAS